MNSTKRIALTAPQNRDYTLLLARVLSEVGWNLAHVPDNGRVAANRQLLVLDSGKYQARFRVFIYKVAKGARGRFNEYKIQITSTYPKGVPRLRDYQDVVLGYFPQSDIFVGFDPRRMEFGGESGTSASYISGEGLRWDRRDEIRILRHTARILPDGIEYHAFFKGPCLAEYLLNIDTIHAGTYNGQGAYSGEAAKRTRQIGTLSVPIESAGGSLLILVGPTDEVTRRPINRKLIEAFEEGKTRKLRRARLTPEQLQAIKRSCEENGHLGEELILKHERRQLVKSRRPELAAKVRWVSQDSVGEGYDILSFEIGGEEKLIEVKSTIGAGRTFEISNNEWEVAKQSGQKYYVYRVLRVRSTKPVIKVLRDPCSIEAAGLIKKSPSGWLITVI